MPWVKDLFGKRCPEFTDGRRAHSDHSKEMSRRLDIEFVMSFSFLFLVAEMLVDVM